MQANGYVGGCTKNQSGKTGFGYCADKGVVDFVKCMFSVSNLFQEELLYEEEIIVYFILRAP